MPTATPASQFKWFMLPRIWELFVVPFRCDCYTSPRYPRRPLFRTRGADMNGFKILAVGAFLYCGPSFCHAQIKLLENPAESRAALFTSAGGDDYFQPAAESDLTRPRSIQAEIADGSAINPFPGANLSPSDTIVDTNIGTAPASDPASLNAGVQYRPSAIDQILRNGSIAQTPDSAYVPVSWPMQQPDNPTARMMLNPGCTQGLWASYPAERAAACARMHQHLAGHHHGRGHGGVCQPCGQAGYGKSTCVATSAQPVNRYAPSACDHTALAPASHVVATQPPHQTAPRYQNLLTPQAASAKPFGGEALEPESETQDNVALLPGLFR